MTGGLLLSGAVAALLTTALPAQSPSSVFDDPPPDKIVIDVATVNGSGCPAGTAAVAVSLDNTAFTVTYSNYLAQAGGDSSPTAFRKNCQLNLVVHVPQGFTYAIASADYRGFLSLQSGATGTQKASYYFQGSPTTVPRTHSFNGPYNDDWQATDSTDWAQLVWAPCGVLRNFNINTELRVSAGSTAPDKVSFMTMDSTDGDISTVYHLAWKECPAQ
ncbi:DUF4360 domain-containing protein [Streptomyces pluripotens]|uniref:DUF4360 domain-containing protein n=1 Tax=Streptomyces pluripotens TaxID=1355015 RepID=A0A221NWI6_9ACTN|nr:MULTISPECIES: DUF4360 domain-containing protein [Streptomyces]ARP70067.1 hypothetical protein LK06_008900 [Streptomyces pluripotens]ASN24327.1 DUF4360 domain-containing protein [Streptomyces pluripotens]KIE25354.1 hypothetical protein LK08_20105 [Streptomyces sp. MUSC 125]MCH0559904.1 DUF4360 domain-containing protein [Streptomyces sp. MUM 16J]